MRIGLIKDSAKYFSPGFEDIVEWKENIRTLGIIVHEYLLFNEHVNNLRNKSRLEFDVFSDFFNSCLKRLSDGPTVVTS